MARGPIHDRHQVQKAVLHRDVRNVGAPDLIGPLYRHAPQQIGINPVSGMGIVGSGRLIDRLIGRIRHCRVMLKFGLSRTIIVLPSLAGRVLTL